LVFLSTLLKGRINAGKGSTTEMGKHNFLFLLNPVGEEDQKGKQRQQTHSSCSKDKQDVSVAPSGSWCTALKAKGI